MLLFFLFQLDFKVNIQTIYNYYEIRDLIKLLHNRKHLQYIEVISTYFIFATVGRDT